MSKRNDTTNPSTKTIAVAVSEKQSITVPESKLAIGRSYGLDDVTVAKSYSALQSNKATAVLQLTDEAYWKLQVQLQVQRARTQRAARAADRSERIKSELDERLARATALLGLTEAEKTLLNAGKALRPAKSSTKAEHETTAAPGNGSNGKSKAALVADHEQAAPGALQ